MSTDAGSTWTDIGPALPDNSGSCTATVVLDSKTFLVGCSGSASAVGIYRSTNSGASWSRVGMTAVWPVPLLAPGSAIYFVAAGGGIQKSADGGLSFAQVTDANTATFLISPTSLVALPDGRIVAVGKDHLQASADGGVTWKPIADPLPVIGGGYDGISGVTYSLQTKTFFIWHWTCKDPVPADAIWSFHFDYEIQ